MRGFENVNYFLADPLHLPAIRGGPVLWASIAKKVFVPHSHRDRQKERGCMFSCSQNCSQNFGEVLFRQCFLNAGGLHDIKMKYMSTYKCDEAEWAKVFIFALKISKGKPSEWRKIHCIVCQEPPEEGQGVLRRLLQEQIYSRAVQCKKTKKWSEGWKISKIYFFCRLTTWELDLWSKLLWATARSLCTW